jgi:hypothetical protein
MGNETRTCQNCAAPFVIETEDFDFYKKMSVPPPTFCPECRLQRRLAWRNERGLSKRKCNAPGHAEDIISIYSDPKLVVYDHEYWWSDAWDALAYGKEYDFSRPFLAQFRELLERTPLLTLADSKSVNSSYCNMTVEQKNCYFTSACWSNEDCAYSNRLAYSKEALDCYTCHKIETGYENIHCKASYRLFWSLQSDSCNDSYFLYDCRGCSHCVGCTGLRNKQYYIWNQPCSKEEYFKKLKELRLESAAGIEEAKQKFRELRSGAIHRYAQILKSVDATGDNIKEAKNCHWCFDVEGSENSKYCNWGAYGMKDCYDSGPGAGGNSELTYEVVSTGVQNARCAFNSTVWYSHDAHYSYNCHSCQYCFGCVSLRNKSYCVLNKQYSKEEYEALLPRVIAHMGTMPYITPLLPPSIEGGVKRGGIVYKYGEFPPVELSPFRYNDTVAQDFYPLDAARAEAEGFPWYTQEKKEYAPTVNAASLPDTIAEVGDDIVKEVVGCAHEGTCAHKCTIAFRVVPQELTFYRKCNIPLPRLCPNCRHYARLRQRNPMKLWRRQCMCTGTRTGAERYRNAATHVHGDAPCPNEFETPYAPERKEIVYCESCYNSEIA